ncbi:MAG: hypothetical protein FWH39_04830, partial [Bacteroidales bacterium]|nr:hypothetical protein [Bacteroidales bacterium]
KGKEAADRASAGAEVAARSDADRMTQQTIGRSVNEIQNMSDAQLEAFAQQQTSARMSAAGLGNMSIAQLEALGSKSDDEIMATLLGSGANNTGLTAEEIMAMEKMNDRQREAYMNQGDRKQRVQAAANSPQAQNQRAQAQTQAASAQAQAQVSAELKQISDRWQEIDRLNQQETEEVAQKIMEIHARYDPQVAAVRRTGGSHGDAYTEAEQRTVNSLNAARFTECYTLWRNQVGKMQGRIKTKLADVARYDELTAQSIRASGGTATAQKMPSIGFSIAGQYLDATSSVTTLPAR